MQFLCLDVIVYIFFFIKELQNEFLHKCKQEQIIRAIQRQQSAVPAPAGPGMLGQPMAVDIGLQQHAFFVL